MESFTHPQARRLCDLLGTRWPLIQAPMAGVQLSALAVAVSECGALGSLPCAMLSNDGINAECAAIRAATRAPFNANFFCHVPPVPDAVREAAWRHALSRYFAECGIDPASIPAGAGRNPFTQEAAEVLSAFAPRVVSFHFGLPQPALLERVRAWDAAILSSATTVEEALWLEAQGVDAIIAQGVEAGGHRGMFLTADLASQPSLWELLPDVVDAVGVPVIAAGGIANAQAVRRAMSLGAAGVQVGTAYLLCPEATTSPIHRAALADVARETALTNLFTGRPARGLVNRLMRDLGPIHAAAPEFPLATAAIAPLRAAAEKLGRKDFSPLWSGTDRSGCAAVPAAQITAGLVRGFE
ncbi:MAG: nitronate monooxygenase [Betaproteobacteria bacterium]|nr:nitronate monooxygenase [Betaproteobacteria bacterium]